MLRIERSTDRECVVLSLSGSIRSEHIPELQAAFAAETLPIALDLQDVKLVNRDAVAFLRRCEDEGITLERCPGYVRKWIEQVGGS